MTKRVTQIGVSHLFLLHKKQILLSRRCNTGYRDGQYSVPAGHIEENESATEAIIREAKEENGINIKAKNLTLIHVMHRHENDKRIDFFFTTKKWQGKLENKEPHKCDHLDWFNLNKLPRNIVPYIEQAINCVLKKQIYSEYGW